MDWAPTLGRPMTSSNVPQATTGCKAWPDRTAEELRGLSRDTYNSMTGRLITTSYFKEGEKEATEDNVAATDVIGLDLDMGDWLAHHRRLGHAYYSGSLAKNKLLRMAEEDPDTLEALRVEHRAVIAAALIEAGLPPASVTVSTGSGHHLWFHLDRLYFREDSTADWNIVLYAMPAMATRINRVAGYDMVDSACTAAKAYRRLRLPGSWNSKNRYAAYPVSIVGRSQTVLTLDALKEWVGLASVEHPFTGVKHWVGKPDREVTGASETTHVDFRTLRMAHGGQGGATLYDRCKAVPRGTSGVRSGAWLPHDGRNSVKLDHLADGTLRAYHFGTARTYVHRAQYTDAELDRWNADLDWVSHGRTPTMPSCPSADNGGIRSLSADGQLEVPQVEGYESPESDVLDALDWSIDSAWRGEDVGGEE